MTFISGPKTIENIPRDQDGISFPDVGESREVAVHRNQRACRMQYGDQRRDLIPPVSVIDDEFLGLVQTSIWKLGYVVNGYLGHALLYNLGLGTANNVVQDSRYEILEIDSSNSRRLRIRGADPRAIGYQVSVENPDFIAPGQDEPRLLTINAGARLPIGSSVRFEFPSCLHTRLNPYIEEIEPPTGPVTTDPREFWIVLSHTAKFSMTPWDEAFPPPDGKYYLAIYSYLTSPEEWFDFQGGEPEAQYALVSRSYPPAAISEGKIELLDSDNQSCRVLHGAFGNVCTLMIEYEGGGELKVAAPSGRISVVDIAVNDWRSFLDVHDLPLENAEFITVGYWATAREADDTIINALGRCAFSKESIDGYGFICTRTECDKYADSYGGATCWDTTASHFSIATEDVSQRPVHMRRWTSEPLVLQQGATGQQIRTAASSHRNFAFERANAPSIQSVVGGFFWQELVGVNERRRASWFGPKMGMRHTFVDDLGRPWQELAHGLYQNEKNIPAVISTVTGWNIRINPRGVPVAGVCAHYPIHRGPSCSLTSFALSEDPAPWVRLARPGDEETIYAEGLEKSKWHPAVEARVRERFL